MASVADLYAGVHADMSGFSGEVQKGAVKAGDDAGKSIADRLKASWSKQNIAKGFTEGLGIAGALGAVSALSAGIGAVTGAITDSLGAANKFDDQLRTINTVAGVSDDQLHRIGDSIQELSRESGQTTDDLTAGFYDLVSAGVPAEHAMDVLKNSAILATGALGSTGEVVDLLTTTLNAYKIDAADSARVTDIFAKAVADGKVTASELGASMAQIAPIAASAGVSLEEVAAGYAQLTKNGVPAAQAATQMRATISALLTPNTELAKIQKQVNVNFAEMAKSDGLAKTIQVLRDAAGSDEVFAKALGSVDALNFGLLTTGDSAASFAAELGSIQDAATKGGTALQQYTEKSKSAAEQQKRFDAQVQTLMQDVGELIQPIYEALVGGATLVIQTIRDLGGAFHDFQRILDSHMAGIEDEDKSLIDLSQQYGINEDALLSYAAAQRKAKTDAAELTAAHDQLRDTFQRLQGWEGLTNDEKNKRVEDLVQQVLALAKASGYPLQNAIGVTNDTLQTLGTTTKDTDVALVSIASQLGLLTTAAGQVVTPLESARKILFDFLNQPAQLDTAAKNLATWARDRYVPAVTEGVAEGVAKAKPITAYLFDFLNQPAKLAEAAKGLADWAKTTYGPALSWGMAAGVDPQPVITRIDRLGENIGPAVDAVINRYAQYLQDHAARIQLPHSASILEQIKKDLRQAAKDLQWELDHPGAWDKLTSTIQARIKKLMSRAQEEDEKGNAHQVEILNRGTKNLIGIWEETTGLSWDYGKGTTENFRRGTLNDLKGIERAAGKVKDKATGSLSDPQTFQNIGSQSIVKYGSGMTDDNAMYWLDNALGRVASHVSDFLRTHSPARRGPLSEAGGPEGFGRSMVQGLADGMLSGLSAVQGASGLVAGATGLYAQSMSALSAGSPSVSISRDQRIVVQHEFGPGTVQEMKANNYDPVAIMSDAIRMAAGSAHIGSLQPRGL